MKTVPPSNDAAGLDRRSAAAHRIPPLACGCADPWVCRCHEADPSERMVDAAADAAHHLLDLGLFPVLDLDTQRALWRRGGEGRRLVSELQALAAAA